MTNKFTQALLTPEDVKQYIYECLKPIKSDSVLNRGQAIKYFGMDHRKFDKYVKLGLPFEGKSSKRKFNIIQCKKWFKDNNISFEENRQYMDD